MGAITGLLGIGGGDAGTGQNITNPTNQNQLNDAYISAQNAQTSQAALLAALQGQNGVQNQSQVYNQLQGVANGTGPNPAQTMLNQSTGQNVANQAALAAGQRGASGNVGLMARQAGQTGAAVQQNAAGQAATLQANQSLNALGQAGNVATNQVENQIGATTANTQAAQSEQGVLNNANAGVNAINGQLANTTVQGQQSIVGGGLQGIGAALMAEGGPVQKLADGGTPQSSAGSFLSGWAGGTNGQPAPIGSDPGAQALSQGMSSLGKGIGNQLNTQSTPMTNSGFTDPELGSQFSSQSLGVSAPSLGADLALSKGGNVGSKLKSGGHVPGKPKVAGNSYANDTVKAMLSPGEVVIPNSVMQSKDPINNAAKFVASIMAKKGLRK